MPACHTPAVTQFPRFGLICGDFFSTWPGRDIEPETAKSAAESRLTRRAQQPDATSATGGIGLACMTPLFDK